MTTSGSDEEEEEQQSSSGDEDDDSSAGSSDGSGRSASSSEEDSDEENVSDADDIDEDELKQARVRGDIQEMRLMVGEMEKIKQRLLFRLEREKQAKLEEADWQQQRLAGEEELRRRQQQQREEKEAERKRREESRIAQAAAAQQQQQQQQQQQSSPDRSVVEIGVQTELSAAPVEHEERMSHEAAEQASKLPSASSQRRTGSALKQTSVPTEGQSARLSLYDLGKSYGMQEVNASPITQRESHHLQQQEQPHGSALAPSVSGSRNAPAPPSEASDSDTFFIRRDSNRTNWQPDLPNHNDSFRRSQDSVLDSEYGSENERIGSPTSRAGTGANKSAFQALRNSILSSIHEGSSNNAIPSTSAASVESSKLFESQRSRVGHLNLSNDDAAKTDEQREQEAIQSLLFGR